MLGFDEKLRVFATGGVGLYEVVLGVECTLGILVIEFSGAAGLGLQSAGRESRLPISRLL